MPAPPSAPRPAVLFDTNVLLDVALARAPWDAQATLLLNAAADGHIRGYVAGHAITTIYYVVAKVAGRVAAATAVSDLLQILTAVELGGAEFSRALALGLSDYEDAVQAAACLRVGAQYLVTRNAPDFKGAPVTTRSPGAVLALV